MIFGRNTWRFFPIFLVGVLLSLHYASVLYINSSFLAQFFSKTGVSLFFMVGAGISLLTFLEIPRWINYLGGIKIFVILVLLEVLAMFGLSYASTALEASGWFLLFYTTLPLIYFTLDIFLEEISRDRVTGEIRGIYLTLVNTAIACGPFLVARLVTGDNFSLIYLVSSLILFPALFVAFFIHSSHKGGNKRARAGLPFRKWLDLVNVRRVTVSRMILNFFYAIMTIFVPPYLRYSIGFEWSEIGVMFGIMLLPFIFLQWPVGRLADKFFGEKEFMTAGFFVTGVSVLLMPFIGPSFVLWTVVLFISRIGASVIEISTESYFFKQINHRDEGIISIFRLTNPLGIILGSLIGMFLGVFLPFSYVLFALSIIILFAMRESMMLLDTR